MKLSLEYLHKQWNLTFKKGLQWKACISAPNTDILEVKITLQLTQNSLATGRILIYNKLVQTHILFFQDIDDPEFNPQNSVMQILYLSF